MAACSGAVQETHKDKRELGERSPKEKGQTKQEYKDLPDGPPFL